jgi:prepilin-type N-terminal cleavage/methylation domain-containing protein
MMGPTKPNQKGFTLIELIAVMIILSTLAAIAVPRYIDLDQNARQRAIDAAVAELNGRESLTWTNIKITSSGWEGDSQTFETVDKFLGEDYHWTVEPDVGGGTLRFGTEGEQVLLTRHESDNFHPGNWSR